MHSTVSHSLQPSASHAHWTKEMLDVAMLVLLNSHKGLPFDIVSFCTMNMRAGSAGSKGKTGGRCPSGCEEN